MQWRNRRQQKQQLSQCRKKLDNGESRMMFYTQGWYVTLCDEYMNIFDVTATIVFCQDDKNIGLDTMNDTSYSSLLKVTVPVEKHPKFLKAQ
jgi:hypothetical protein